MVRPDEKILAGKIQDFLEGRAKVVKVRGIDVAVFQVGGKYYAFKDACPHQGHSLKGGRILNSILSCPGHNWQFEIESGRCVKGDKDISLRRFEAEVNGDSVFIIDSK